VFKINRDILASRLGCKLLTNGIEPGGTRAHREIVNDPRASCLPHHEAGFTWKKSVYQDFPGIDCHRLSQGSPGHSYAQDIGVTIDDQRFAHHDRKDVIVRSLLSEDTGNEKAGGKRN